MGAVLEIEGLSVEVDGKRVLSNVDLMLEVEYLMARGIPRDEAVSMIVRGFLRVEIEGLPPRLAADLQRAIQIADKEAL